MLLERTTGAEPAISTFCVMLSVTAGVGLTLAAVCVAYPEQRARQSNQQLSTGMKIVSIVCNVIFTGVAVACNILAVGRGPVAIVTPLAIGANLLSNMVIQPLLGIAAYTQNTIIGTLVLVAAITMLVEVGPTDIDPNQSVLDLVTHATAVAFICFSALILIFSICTIARGWVTQNVYLVFLYATIAACAKTVNAAVIKVVQLDIPNNVRVPMLIVYLTLACVGFVNSARANGQLDDPSLFIPLGAGVNLVLTCLAGLFIWEDGVRLKLSLSYATIYVIVILASYLVSKDDILSTTNNNVTEAHVNKLSTVKNTSLFLSRARRAARARGEEIQASGKNYTDHNLHPQAPRGRLARCSQQILRPTERSSELAS